MSVIFRKNFPQEHQEKNSCFIKIECPRLPETLLEMGVITLQKERKRKLCENRYSATAQNNKQCALFFMLLHRRQHNKNLIYL